MVTRNLARAVFVCVTAFGIGACKGSKSDGAAASPAAPTATKQPAGLPGQSEADLGETVATIDGTPISVAEFQDRINKQSPYVRARYTSLEQKKEFLDTLVRFEVLAAEARKRGYDRDAEVVRTMKQVMIQRLLKEEFDNRVKPEDVSEDEMKKYYDAHTSDYNKPEEARVSAIVVKDKAKAGKVAAEAKLPANQDNKAFRDLVTKYSEDDESKLRGGDLRYFTADAKTVPKEVAAAAFELKNQGDVSAPIQTANGFYILKQTGSRKAINKTFDDVKRQIQNHLYRDKRTAAMQEFESDLKKKAKIEVHSDSLAKVKIDNSQVPTPSPEGIEPGTTNAPGQPAPGAKPPTPGMAPAPTPTPAAAPPAATPPPATK